MLGDAANDAESISLEGVVGISLRHGATPCKLGADFIVDNPGGLLSLRTELHSRALAGASWLLEDVCLLCGLVSSLTFCGIWTNGFAFLPRGFLYDDPFDARIMTLFSGCAYPVSACSAACVAARVANCNPSAALVSPACGPTPCASSTGRAFGSSIGTGSQARSARPVRMLLFGTCVGFMLGMVGPTDDTARFGRYILTATFSVCMLRHLCVSLMISPIRAWLLTSAGHAGIWAERAIFRMRSRFCWTSDTASPYRAVHTKLTKLVSAATIAADSGSYVALILKLGSRPSIKLVVIFLLLLLVWL